ncbi:hypothetical protein BUALT_Bualt04G0181100 [Buddleja alternifolia]|uniref:Tyrosine--tRNA ligase n=1 Tax=Buddleja alternifolia TaxID=168488 RepID=A0AAV6XWQ8_9LAMI|nr:hypothetical protein BUALT_Bualt04G0181100 [Buddleja alternifolia]
MTCKMCIEKVEFILTVIYASNDEGRSKELWRDLMRQNYQDKPWVLMGDWNTTLLSNEKLTSDGSYMGVMFQEKGISDHSPMVLSMQERRMGKSPFKFLNGWGRRGLRQRDPMSPFLFAIVMDYLTRSFKLLHKDPSFKYHHKCKRVRLINLCFADDLMMFCKGEGKFKKVDFERDRLCGRRNAHEIFRNTPDLNQTNERVVLIKAVLFRIQMFWSQIFPLLIFVVHEMERTCRSYLWSGKPNGKHYATVKWSDLCVSKKEGGLGFISLRAWNVAALFKQMAAFGNSARTLVLLLTQTTQRRRPPPPLFYQFPLLLSPSPPPPYHHHHRLYSSRRNVVEILQERGLLDSLTADALLRDSSSSSSTPLKVYCGFDPTAESLHLGNLLGIIVLSWFLHCGHHAVALVGGATGRVGDPSGKSLERPELDPLTLDTNVSSISTTIQRILERSPSSSSFTILNNYEWWKDVKLLDFLRDVGRFARVGAMMSKESVRKRLDSEQGMSYTEFTYQLLQGYDFLHLFRHHGVNVQIGGSDQWGNITAGTDLIRRILQADQIGDGPYGLTFPLLLKSDGTKFGKSEDGAIWLSPSLLSPYQFYQYFFTVSDSDVIRFLKILTFLSIDEISHIHMEMQGPAYVPNTAQRRLAEEVTRFVHGQQGLDEALKATQALKPGAETNLDWETIETIAEDVPSFSLPQHQVLNLSLLDLTVATGLLDSKSAARRLLKQGGLYLNNKRVDSEAKKIEPDDIVDGKVILLSAGKKNKMIVRIS